MTLDDVVVVGFSLSAEFFFLVLSSLLDRAFFLSVFVVGPPPPPHLEAFVELAIPPPPPSSLRLLRLDLVVACTVLDNPLSLDELLEGDNGLLAAAAEGEFDDNSLTD